MRWQFDNQLVIAGKAVKGDLQIDPTGIHLLLGNNGVGKTSLFRYLLDHSQQLGLMGKCSFFSQHRVAPVGGMKVRQVFEQLQSAFPDRIYSQIHNHPLAQILQLNHLMEREVTTLSGGENQVIKLLLGFSVKAQYYFLDEPFQYLDAVKFQALFDYLVGLKDVALVIIDHRNPEMQTHAHRSFVMKDMGDWIELKEQR